MKKITHPFNLWMPPTRVCNTVLVTSSPSRGCSCNIFNNFYNLMLAVQYESHLTTLGPALLREQI